MNKWVRLTYHYDDGDKTTIERLTSDTRYRYTFNSSVNGRNYAMKERCTIKDWKPNVGEWCWFWDDYEYPMLRMSEGDRPSEAVKYPVVMDMRFDEHCYQHCEPFMGRIPDRLRG